MATHQLPNASQASVRLYKRIALTFIGLTMVLLGVVLAATLSRATVTITPKPVSFSSEVKVSVATESKTSETVPGTVVSTTLSGEKKATAAGTGTTVRGKATGKVLLVNKRASSQSLIATTRLVTAEGVLFRLKKGVVIPANGELKDVEVIADKDGAESEIGPSTFTIPGLPADLQKIVYAFSEKPMTGGLETISTVAQEDIDKAVLELKDELIGKASAELASQIAGRGFTGSAIMINEDARSVSAKAGDKVGSFDVLLKLTVTGVYYNKEKLQNIGLSALKANVPTDMELGSNDVTSANVVVQNASAADKTATLGVVFNGTAILTPMSQVLDKSRIVGLDETMIKAYLKSFDSVSEVNVSFAPFWVKKAPTMKDHIKMIVK